MTYSEPEDDEDEEFEDTDLIMLEDVGELVRKPLDHVLRRSRDGLFPPVVCSQYGPAFLLAEVEQWLEDHPAPWGP